MRISDEDLKNIRSMSDSDLVRSAGTPDLAVVVEANLRLKRATTILTWVLIALTVVLVILGALPFFK
jgi:hypothetical protein